MISSLLKIPYLRLKYRFFPSEAQAFWAQELFESQALSGKLGQILAQGQKANLPKSSLTATEAAALFAKNFPKEKITLNGEVLAASMGQVFFGEWNAQKVAVKILHPGIKNKIKSEIDNILLLGGYFAKSKGFKFDKAMYRRFLTEVFEEETNLIREKDFQLKFRETIKSNNQLLIPNIHLGLSNAEVLTQERVDATLARDLVTIPHFDIFHFFFNALFNHSVLHGDLNDRNWGINEKNQTVIYDFGCTQIVSERRIGGLKKLLNNVDIVNGFQEFGVRLAASVFVGREQELRDKIFGPLLDHPITADLKYSAELQNKLGEDVKQLREYTDPWVLLFMRSLFSLIRIYQERGVTISLHDILSPYLVFKEKSMQATQLKVEVTEGKNLIVSLGLPISALENLEQLMPENVLNKIREENLDMESLKDNVKDSDFAPQELFNFTSGDRRYRVWID